MVDTGKRFTYSLDKENFRITDNLSGETIIFENGMYLSSSIDRDDVLNHLRALVDALTIYRRRRKIHRAPSLCNSTTVIISEISHFKWSISTMGCNAIFDNGLYTCNKRFDITYVLRRVNHVIAQLLCAKVSLNPKRDIVRRIVDVGLLVWVYSGHSVVVYEDNVSGVCMNHCLIDGKYYRSILVGTSKRLNSVTLFTTNLEEVMSFPVDNSVLTYYPDLEDNEVE